jgi:hypothetical protein
MADVFHMHGGGSFGDLDSFELALIHMDEHVFAHHMDGRNDFALWIEHALRKPLLAALVRQCRTAHEMAVVLETYQLVGKAPEQEILVSDVVRRLVGRFS